MSHDDKGREVYFKDAKAYYDPTMLDKKAQRAKLQSQIKSLTAELNDNNKPLLIIGKMKSSVSVQNFVNTNKEETNEFIANSYYYPVDRRTLANRVNRQNGNNHVHVEPHHTDIQPEAINIYTRKPERIRIGSVSKYYDDNVKSGMVEAESTGVVQADKRFYYESSAATVNNNVKRVENAVAKVEDAAAAKIEKKVETVAKVEDTAAAKIEKKVENNIVQNAVKDTVQDAIKAPNTQGLKTGGFRILRKSN